jgi:outer membrane protein TolC
VRGQIRDYGLTAGVQRHSFYGLSQCHDSRERGEKTVDASKFSRGASIQEIVYIAKLSYYSALLAENTLKIAEASYDNSIKNKDILEKRSYGGRSSRGDRIRMDADIAARMPTVNNARAQFMSALQTLHTVTDVSPGTDIILIDSCAESCGDMDRGALEAALMENEPSLKALDKTLESQRMVWAGGWRISRPCPRSLHGIKRAIATMTGMWRERVQRLLDGRG